MQNNSLSMTKESYFEMCEQLGSEPVEEEIPVEFDDFPLELQQAFIVYRMLQDQWEGMNGLYLGKSLTGIHEIFFACEIEPADYKYILILVRIIDQVRQEQVNSKTTKKPA
jgi:hypothetical protein